jgi:integrase/recombinase XerD
VVRTSTTAGHWVRRFLVEHLVDERNLAHNTQRSYRDAFCQLMPFVAQDARKAIDLVSVEDLAPDRVRRFLTHLEKERQCTIRTRNQRLAAVHAFARFVAQHSPEHIAWCAGVRAVPFKRFDRAVLCYLEKAEIDALIAAPNRDRAIGRRDRALLLFLYNTGARASEAAGVSIHDIEFRPDGTGSVKLVGKGGKTRCCPLWPATLAAVKHLSGKRLDTEVLFLNQRGEPLTRYGIHHIVRRHATAIGEELKSVRRKRIGPHTIRHTTATHLLRAGVDINSVRAWLGHVSIDTTNVYAEIDLEAKTKMLDRCQSPMTQQRKGKRWKNDPKLMDFLRSL